MLKSMASIRKPPDSTTWGQQSIWGNTLAHDRKWKHTQVNQAHPTRSQPASTFMLLRRILKKHVTTTPKRGNNPPRVSCRPTVRLRKANMHDKDAVHQDSQSICQHVMHHPNKTLSQEAYHVCAGGKFGVGTQQLHNPWGQPHKRFTPGHG